MRKSSSLIWRNPEETECNLDGVICTLYVRAAQLRDKGAKETGCECFRPQWELLSGNDPLMFKGGDLRRDLPGEAGELRSNHANRVRHHFPVEGVRGPGADEEA